MVWLSVPSTRSRRPGRGRRPARAARPARGLDGAADGRARAAPRATFLGRRCHVVTVVNGRKRMTGGAHSSYPRPSERCAPWTTAAKRWFTRSAPLQLERLAAAAAVCLAFSASPIMRGKEPAERLCPPSQAKPPPKTRAFCGKSRAQNNCRTRRPQASMHYSADSAAINGNGEHV